MKKSFIVSCAFVLATLGMKAQTAPQTITVPGTLGSTGTLGTTLIANCAGNLEVCCVIMVQPMANPNGPGSVTIDRKTYSFTSWSNKDDGKGKNELTFRDAKLK